MNLKKAFETIGITDFTPENERKLHALSPEKKLENWDRIWNHFKGNYASFEDYLADPEVGIGNQMKVGEAFKVIHAALHPHEPSSEPPPPYPQPIGTPGHDFEGTFDEWFDCLKVWHTPDSRGEKLADMICFDNSEIITDGTWIYRCSIEDIIEGKVTEKALGIVIERYAEFNNLVFFPKSVVCGWKSPGRSGFPGGLIISHWFAKTEARTGGAYVQVDRHGRML